MQAPAFLRNRLQGPGGNRAGIAGAFVMGMVAGLVASPCVGPFLSALLLWVGTTGSLFLGFWTLFVFGLGVSTLLVLVGTFPAAMGSLPQSGGWMETVKRAMGVLLVFMAFYFVRPGVVLPEQVFYPLLGAVTIVVAIFLGAFDTIAAGAHWWDRTRKALGLITLVIGLYLFGGALLRYGLLLPGSGDVLARGTTRLAAVETARGAPGSGTSARDVVARGATDAAGPTADADAPLPPKVPWQLVHTGENVRAFIDERIALARETGQPVVIDFWATWCKFCKQLDKKVWNQPAVVRESLRYIPIKVDATKSDAEMDAIWADYNITGLPTIIFIDSRGEVLHGKTLTGFVPAEQMVVHMASIR
jgi:thiol:disulfide interchange protein DsbD